MNPYHWLHLAGIAWIILLLYWFVSAEKLKSVKLREPGKERLIQIVFMAAAYSLLFNDQLRPRLAGEAIHAGFGQGRRAAVAATFVGVAFALWARRHLGENWSAAVTLKEGHELIASGPYRRIRHPIYTGMLLAFAGSSLSLGEYRALLSLPIVLLAFYRKAKKEECFLLQEFGDKFRDHSRRTGLFLPGGKAWGASFSPERRGEFPRCHG